MKEATAKRIEAIKAGKFGVEIEMYNITREKAARIVAEFFGTNGVEHRCSYDRWICKDEQGREWHFMSDSSIHDCHGGCEMVTPVLGYSDIEKLQEVMRLLRKNGAKSDPDHECGVHIHIDAEGQTPATLRNLANLMASHDNLIMNAIGVGAQRRRWCRPVSENFVKEINKQKPATMDDVMRVWYESHGEGVWERNQHYAHSRYHILNLHSLWQGKGIEFRCFQFDNPTAERKGGLHAGQMKAYIQLCLALCEAAKAVSRVSAKKVESNNERYTMRHWLTALKMDGEEFKTARKIIIRNLEGNVAYRNRTATVAA